MSRVLKAGQFELQPPVVISPAQIKVPDEAVPVDTAASGEETGEESPTEDVVSQAELLKIRNEADAILRETELMVKELLETARQEAEKIISSANEKADNLVTESKTRLQQIEDDAYQAGWQQGFTEGGEQARQEHTGLLTEARKTLEDAADERDKIIRGAEDEIAQLAVAVARKIIFREMSSDQSIIGDIVTEAIKKVTDREEITVKVNPADLDQVLGRQDELTGTVKGIRKLKIMADNAVSQGGCFIETSNGTVDARLESQLAEIQQSLLEVSGNGES